MARRSAISRLPAETRELIAARRRDGRTIAEIRAELLERGVKVSKSALAGHTRQLDAAAPEARSRRLSEDIRAIRVGVETIAARLSERGR